MIRLFELFRGYGSQGLELDHLGIDYKNVGGCEIYPQADIAHKALHGKIRNYGDITQVRAKDLPDHDLCTYSFPCTTVSVAGLKTGLKEGSGTASSLLWECRKVIEVKKPKYLMMENVKNLVGKQYMSYFVLWLEELRSLGYNNYWKVINAKNCGIPQNRDRLFCVSILKEHDNFGFHFYEDFDSGLRLKDMLEDDVDDKYYLSDAMTKTVLKTGTKNFYYPPEIDCDIAKPLTASMAKMHRVCQDNYISEKFEKIGERTLLEVDGRDVKIVETCAMRGRNPDNPKSRKSGLPTKQIIEIADDPSIMNCLTTVQKDTLVLEKPDFRLRKLTPRECFRLMGLYDSEIDKILATGLATTHLYKLAGNAIVLGAMQFLDQLK